MKARIEITKESGEVMLTERFSFELAAHTRFESLEEIRYPLTYRGLTMNLSEYDDSGTIGEVRLIAEHESGKEYERRSLYRKA